MKKTYIAPTLHSVELGSESICDVLVTSGHTTSTFKSSKYDTDDNSSESIWDGSWKGIDED